MEVIVKIVKSARIKLNGKLTELKPGQRLRTPDPTPLLQSGIAQFDYHETFSQAILSVDYEDGAVLWAERHRRDLATQLRQAEEKIDELWKSGTDPCRFVEVVREFKAILQRISDEYRKQKKDPSVSPNEEPVAASRSGKSIFNQTNENIDWARWTWNPVTGCRHNCPYCYARDIANRFYGHFNPQFHPERLSAPRNTKLPAKAKEDIGYRNVFVCSMADLFGHWVPQEWIDQVLRVVGENPQWNFIFLTKNPRRYLEIPDWPANCWIGATADCQLRYNMAVEVFKKLQVKNVKFLSFEPLEEEIEVLVEDFRHIDWVIIGGRSKTARMPEAQPEWPWVERIVSAARKTGVAIYYKPNLKIPPGKMAYKEYPGFRKWKG